MATNSLLQRPLFVICAAALLLALAIVLIWSNLGAKGPSGLAAAAEAQAPKTIPVIVAAVPIARGQILGAGDVTAQPMREAPPSALHDTADATGRMALDAIAAGTPVRRTALSPMAVTGIAAHIPQGFRAYSIAVSDADIAGGFVQTGDHVDLYVTLPSALFATAPAGGRPADESKSRLLLQHIAVLAVGTKLKTDGTASTQVRTVTLALKSEDLAGVALAGKIGTLSLAIRNPMDDAVTGAELASLESLVPRARSAAQPSPRRAAATGGITVYDGRARAVVQVPQ